MAERWTDATSLDNGRVTFARLVTDAAWVVHDTAPLQIPA